MKYTSLTWVLIIFLLAACDTGSQRRINREALQEEIANREPKRISEAQITQKAYEQGKLIADEAQKVLLNTLQKALDESDPRTAVEYCALNAHPLMDSLSRNYKAALTIRRTSPKTRNPANKPDEIEKQLLEAYEYNIENNLPLDDNVQRLSYEHLLYSKPIVISNELCLRCHGEEEKDIEPQTLHTLNRLYPEDKARNYKMGDFRGIWSIKLSQKELVNAL